jgi:hypothetical protein
MAEELVRHYDIRVDQWIDVPHDLKERADQTLEAWRASTGQPPFSDPDSKINRTMGDQGLYKIAYDAAVELNTWINAAYPDLEEVNAS